MSELYQNHDIPAINPFQYDISAEESVQEHVNLFRGAVSFCYYLAELPERNGIGIKLSAMYQGEVCQAASTGNTQAPVSVLGLGWELGNEDIFWYPEENYLLPHQRQYYFRTGSSTVPLYRNLIPWQRGWLAKEFAPELEKSETSALLAEAFMKQGLPVAEGASLKKTADGKVWLTDAWNGEVYRIEEGEEQYQILDGGDAYESAVFDFSRIRYYKELELWKITDRDGMTSVYGGYGQHGETDALSLWVVWNGWKGASACTKDADGSLLQTQIPWSYHLRKKYNQWGDAVSYRYEQIREQVGEDGLEYTKACYLSELTDMFGHRVALQYGEKQYCPGGGEDCPREYADVHKKVPDDTADVWQTCYETKYLKEIDVYYPDGSLMNRVELDYKLDYPYPAEDIRKQGDMVKRFLTAIRLVNEKEMSQSISFSYMRRGEKNAGAICEITYPQGEIVKYQYTEKELPFAQNAKMRISNPYGQGAPKVWFGDDYCLVLWVQDNRMTGSFYTFSGRWQEWNPGNCFQGIDAGSLRSVQGEGFLLLLAERMGKKGSSCLVFHKDDSVVCSFRMPEETYLEGIGWEVCAGDNFYLLWNRLDRCMEGKVWNRRKRDWEHMTLDLPEAEIGEERFFCSNGKCVAAFCLDANQNQTALHFGVCEEPVGFRTVVRLELPEIFPVRGDTRGLCLDFKRDILALSVITEQYQNGFYYDIYLWVAEQKEGDYHLTPYEKFSAKYEKEKEEEVQKEQWAALIVDENMVMAGGRMYAYNGCRWQENTRLADKSGRIDQRKVVYAYTQGLALKTEYHGNEVAGTYLTYRPETDSAGWNSVPVQQFRMVQEDGENRGMPTASGNLVSWDLKLYQMDAFQKGEEPFREELEQLPDGADTILVFNRGDNYLAFPFREKEKACLMVLKNGAVLEQREYEEGFHLLGEDAEIEGELPGNAFACYTYTKEAENVKSINLYWLGRVGMEEHKSCYQVAAVSFGGSSFGGGKRFEYDANYAASDNMAQSVGYYRTRVYPDLGIGCNYGYTDYYYHNSLALVKPSENQEQISLADGQLIATVEYNSQNKEMARLEVEYEYDSRAWIEGEERFIAGAWLKRAVITRKNDGVTTQEEVCYHNGNGLSMESRKQNYNGLGEAEVYRETARYGFEVYERLRFQNNMTACVGQERYYKKEQEPEQVITASAAVYDVWEQDAAPWKFSAQGSYQWQGGDYKSFDYSRKTTQEGWEQISLIEKRSSHGLVLEKQEPMGEAFSVIYDAQEKNITATVSEARASLGEAFYYGFEAYEQTPDWNLSEKTPIICDYAHTGSRCLCIPAGTETAPLICTILQLEEEKEWMLQYWSEAEAGCEAGVRVELPDGTSIEQNLNPGEGWQANAVFFQAAPGKGKENVCRISFYNKGNTAVYVDNLSMSFPKTPVSARVYDKKGALFTAMVGAYDECEELIYDDWQRKIGSTSHDMDMTQWRAVGLGSMSGSERNTLFVAQACGSSYYEKFDGLGKWNRNWTVQGNFSTAENALCHEENSRGSVSFIPLSEKQTGYAAAFLADMLEEAELSVTLAEGITILWKQGVFCLSDAKEGISQKVEWEKPGHYWLAIWGESVLFLVDGTLVFTWLPKEKRKASFALQMTGKVTIRNVLLGEQPQVGMQYFDKTGHLLQGHSLNGTQFTVTAMGYDVCGRAAFHTRPVRYESSAEKKPLRFREEFITSMDENGVLSGEVADVYPEDEGYPYAGQRYEDYPNGRVAETGAPGRLLAIRGGEEPSHTTRYAYGCNEGMTEGLPFPEGKYYKTEVTDSNGNITIQYQNMIGQKVAEMVCLPEQKLITSYLTHYEKAAVVNEVRLPMWYDSTQEGHEKFVYREIYDYSGNVMERSDMDTGMTSFFYLKDGRLRFSQDAVQKKQGMISYWKYDEAKRVTEEGIFCADWNREVFRQHMEDVADWPGEEQKAEPKRQYCYDGNRSLCEMGELTETMTKSWDDVWIISQMQYDRNHRMTAKRVEVTGKTILETVSLQQSYTYDTAQKLLSLTYSDGNSVFFTYDQEGKVIQVKNEKGENILSYSYNESDMVEKVIQGSKTQGAVTYRYNSGGWPLEISGPFMEETLTYEKSREEGPFNGKLSCVEVKLKLQEQKDFPSFVRYDISYDAAGRLTRALCSADGKEYPEWSLGADTPIQYDADGNIEAIQAGGEIEKYLYEAGTNRIRSTDKTGAITYDENGRVISVPQRGILKIEYPEMSCLPISMETEQETVRYRYDENGQRICRETDDTRTIYLRNAEGHIIEEIQFSASDGGKKESIQYLYGTSGLAGCFREGEFLYAHTDHLGSLRGITKTDGTVISAYQYAPFGETRSLSEAQFPSIHGFVGYEWEEAAQLYFSGGRLYDPVLRAFYGADAKRQYASAYAYCGNDPFSMVDPNGESSWWAILIGAIVGIVATAVTAGVGGFIAGAAAASEIGATVSASAVGAVAGATGSMLGATVTAAVDSEPITASLLLGSLASGAIGGASGGLTGGVGQPIMQAARQAGYGTIRQLTRAGLAVSTISGVLGGAASATEIVIGGGSLKEGKNWISIGIGALTGMGAALLSTNTFFGLMNIMPIPDKGDIKLKDLYHTLKVNNVNAARAYFGSLYVTFGRSDFTAFIPEEQFAACGNRMLRKGISPFAIVNGIEGEVLAVHGLGRRFFPVIEGEYHMMYQKEFVTALTRDYAYLVGNGQEPLKLMVCFSAMFGRYSNAQALANATKRNTYATLGITYPERENHWRRFEPH